MLSDSFRTAEWKLEFGKIVDRGFFAVDDHRPALEPMLKLVLHRGELRCRLEEAEKALLRRVEAMAQNARIDAGETEVAGLRIDPVARTAQVEGRPLELTPREFDLLYFFARQPGKVFSRMDLLNAVWGYSHEGYEHTVNTHINRLRAKIESDPAQPVRILTVWGRGYKFAAAQESA